MKILFLIFFFTLSSGQDLIQYKDPTVTLERNVAEPQQFPYQVSLRYTTENLPHFCSGAIISPTHVLTAARCLRQADRVLNDTDFKIIAGNIDLYPSVDAFVTRTVKQIFINPNFDSTSFANDLAIIEINREFPVNIPDVRRVLIADAINEFDDCFSSGWGIKNYNSSTLNPTLHYMKMNVVDDSKCNLRDEILVKNSSSICVESLTPNYFFCQGDAGDPLVCSNRLVGLVSWGYTCDSVNTSFAMVNVTGYKTWIDSVIKSSNSATSITIISYLLFVTILIPILNIF